MEGKEKIPVQTDRELNNRAMSADQVLNRLTNKFIEINKTLDYLAIKDATYHESTEYNVRQALITVAVIRACGGLGKDAEILLSGCKKCCY